MASVVVTHALNNFREGNVLTYIGDLDGDTLALFSIGNDDDETTLDTGDTVALLANIVNLYSSGFAFLDRWFLGATLTALSSICSCVFALIRFFRW